MHLKLTPLLLLAMSVFQKECVGQREEQTAQAPVVKIEPIKWHPAEVKGHAGEQSKAFKIENILPKGYVKDGSVDYTSYVQLALSKHKQIVFPGFPILVNDEGLKIGSDRTITFLEGSEIRLKPSAKKSYEILSIKDARNVTLINPVVVGDWDKHIGTEGEWGNGIKIGGSSNVTLYNPKVSNCWGDGIYISATKSGVPKNIRIVNAFLKKNRRNGLSVISVDGLVLESPYSGYNDGISPRAGIDIEPNKSYDEIKNVKIFNPKTEKNGGSAISIGLNKLYGRGDKNVSIEIRNHVDHGSRNGLLISCSTKKSVAGEKIIGNVTVMDPLWQKNFKQPLSVYKLREPNLKLSVTNPQLVDLEGKKLSKSAFIEDVETTIGKEAVFTIR